MRLPLGYKVLKSRFGRKIRAARRSRRMSQAVLAGQVGISRETLSRIEYRNRIPRPQILDAIMQALDLEWSQVAKAGRKPKSRPFIDGLRGDQISALGKELQIKRLSQGKSLRALSAEFGISIATLSRFERGQLSRSRLFEEMPTCAGVDFESRRVQLCHPKLAIFLSVSEPTFSSTVGAKEYLSSHR